MDKKVDYVVKSYTNLSELQKHLNQWKHQYNLTIEGFTVSQSQILGNDILYVIIKREEK